MRFDAHVNASKMLHWRNGVKWPVVFCRGIKVAFDVEDGSWEGNPPSFPIGANFAHKTLEFQAIFAGFSEEPSQMGAHLRSKLAPMPPCPPPIRSERMGGGLSPFWHVPREAACLRCASAGLALVIYTAPLGQRSAALHTSTTATLRRIDHGFHGSGDGGFRPIREIREIRG
jgi:hypothetical protein